MLDRRELMVLAGAAALLPGRARAAAALAGFPGTPEEAAADEALWLPVQQAYAVDRSLLNLNNGGTNPAPVPVMAALHRHHDFSNAAPVQNMWRVLEPQREGVRQQVARFFGCDAEEIALTRNTTEGLQAVQLGLPLERGDEVLMGDQEYPAMINAFARREKREGIKVVLVPVPVPAEDPAEVVRLFEQRIGPRTRLLLVSHMVYLTGQVLPVKELIAMAAAKGVEVLVDGAHTFAHLPMRMADLGASYYAASLHKWLGAPHGTGLLFVRRERIPGVLPLYATAPELDQDIRKFEQIGTHPAAPYLAVAEALAFHLAIGPERKAARLRYLRDRWARPLAKLPGVRLHTSLDPRFSCGLGLVQLEGIRPAELAAHLWSRHRIVVCPIEHPRVSGIRVAPNVYTLSAEIDRFAEILAGLAGKGLPR